MKTIVLSGINLFEGGPLSIYKDCLDAITSLGLDKQYRFIAFVHKRELFRNYPSTIEFIELPRSRTHYLYRFYYEYIYFKKYSKQMEIDIWISLHDMTPNVKANKQYTYCHNPTPFLKVDKNLFKYNKKNFLMCLLYRYIYRINIKKNTAVIVQQNWIRAAFKKMFPIKKIIVAKPEIHSENDSLLIPVNENKSDLSKKFDAFSFIYAAYPRPFKNFEVICEAAKLLEKEGKIFKIFLTIDGNENLYTQTLKKKYENLKSIVWLGLLSREQLFKYYQKIDVMIFPSKLETWGLPISEFKLTNKPIIIADLPYAHETVGTYNKVCFFNENNAYQLSNYMKLAIEGKEIFGSTKVEKLSDIAENWTELLLKYIICESDKA